MAGRQASLSAGARYGTQSVSRGQDAQERRNVKTRINRQRVEKVRVDEIGRDERPGLDPPRTLLRL